MPADVVKPGAGVNTGSKAQIFLGTKLAAATAAQFASDTYTKLGKVEGIGAFGVKAGTTTFTDMDQAWDEVFKTSASGGTCAITIGFSEGDGGQQAIAAAVDDFDTADYNLKIVLVSGATIYLRVKVLSDEFSGFNTKDVVKKNVEVAINARPLLVLKAAAGGA